jgi:GNAT superfamily N-acetyltransferase
MAEWTIQRLARRHERSSFDFGQPALNDWLIHKAGQFERRDLARTYVATRPEETHVGGYYAISSHRVLFEALPEAEAKGLPRLDVPVLLLGRLAVDQAFQGKGLGALLLIDALRRALHVAEQVGIRAVEVDAIDESARKFYLKYGFRSLLDDARHLFMPMHEIRKLKIGSAAVAAPIHTPARSA